jgi:hypothetical protein
MTTAASTPTLTIELTENYARYVLEALQMLEAKWLHIKHTSTNEDQQADFGMDALDLHGTRNPSSAKRSRHLARALRIFRGNSEHFPLASLEASSLRKFFSICSSHFGFETALYKQTAKWFCRLPQAIAAG